LIVPGVRAYRLLEGLAVRAAVLGLVAGLATAPGCAQVGGASSPTDAPPSSDNARYLELLARRDRARRQNTYLKLESDLSAKRTAYAVLDLSDRKLYFKVRGRAFKAIPFGVLEVSRSGRTIEPDELAWRSFMLELKEGKGVETETIQRRTLSEEETRLAGGGGEQDVEPEMAEQGAVQESAEPGAGDAAEGAAPGETRTAGVAGGEIPPDPPPKYHMGFDGGLSVWVEADVPRTARAARYEAILSLARRIGRLWGAPAGSSRDTRITVRLPLPQAQQIFRQLLPGQRLLIAQ